MNLLINDKEIVAFLVDVITSKTRFYNFPSFTWPETTSNASRLKISYEKNKKLSLHFDKETEVTKVKKKMLKYINTDLKAYVNQSEQVIEDRKRRLFLTLHKNIDKVFNILGEEKIFRLYKNYKTQNFIKTVGFDIEPRSKFVRRSKITDIGGDCLLRNTVNNEGFLVGKIKNNSPFWFIDSGYTNFLETNKKWHRLVRNHIHFDGKFEAPVNRLGIFKDFPKNWRHGGHIILVIEPGPFSAKIFGINVKEWRTQVETHLRQYTDKKIIFREKFPKKVRKSLYKELMNDDYYCLININSNAATEAIWNGIPVITLDRHVTNTVTRQNLSDINNLYRPNLANWLCSLSYSQFSYDELMNGTAVKLVRQYYA